MSTKAAKLPAILLGGPHEGKRTQVIEPAPRMLSCAPLPLFPSGRVTTVIPPPWWVVGSRLHRWWYDAHTTSEPAPPEPPRPPDVYRLAGTLDDGTRVYRHEPSPPPWPQPAWH